MRNCLAENSDYKYLYQRSGGDYNLLMAYPSYETFALSSLGYLWLNMKASEAYGINSNMIFTDSKSFPASKDIDAVAFSLSYDLDFMGVFSILERLGLSFFSNENRPLLFAGGPVITTNPEPFKKIFDFMIIGDGESVFIKVLNILKQKLSKQDTLKLLSEIEGIYVPVFYRNKIIKISEKLNNVIYTPIITSKSYFKNTFIVELARGCMNRCAFCTASYTNLPFRNYQYEDIIKTIELGLKYTNKIALLGAQISAHPQFNEIIEYLKNKIKSGYDIEFGLSSLRTDAITPEVIQALVLGGQKHSTIAIEAGSERLRKFINKNLKKDDILNAVKISRENGLKGLKIYSMIGIPTETDEDIQEFIKLAETIKKENKGFNIEFSFSTFVPKPHTPFQWEKREDTKSLEKKQKYLEKEFSKIGVSSKFSSAKWDYWQTVISRGDDTLGEFLVRVYELGGKIGSYKTAQKELNINTEKFISCYSEEECLPWDFIEMTPDKEHLKKERKRLSKFEC